jgi:ribonuclease HII
MGNNTLLTIEHELELQNSGFSHIAGIDEAGRGAWAGPVIAAAVILPLTASLISELIDYGVNDSKKLNARQRDTCRVLIEHIAIAFALGDATHSEIDELGIIRATRLAMIRAVQGLTPSPEALVIDAVRLPSLSLKQDVFYYADSISVSVAAASILAKTSRDTYMRHLDEKLPGYGFSAHKGYGTQLHQEALKLKGVTWAHRRTYAPIKRLLQMDRE